MSRRMGPGGRYERKHTPGAGFEGNSGGGTHVRRRLPLTIRATLTLCLIALVLIPSMAWASRGVSNSISYISIEADTGFVIEEHNADVPRPAASMVKMVMMLMVAEGIEEGRWTLETPIETSAHAASMDGTQVYLQRGDAHSLEAMVRAIAVISANDAATAIAENLWGSEAAYLEAMNKRVREWGMTDSTFYSVNGLPPRDDNTPFDRTTARDMAILGQWCVRNPLVMEWTGQQSLRFSEGAGIRGSTNRLLGRTDEIDGIKTGYTRAAGFCITSTAKRDDVRVIAVVMGHPNRDERFDLAQGLLEDALRDIRRVTLVAAGEPIDSEVTVYNSTLASFRPVAAEDLQVIIRESDRDRLRMVAQPPRFVRAPLAAGEAVGEMAVQLGDQLLQAVALVTPDPIESPGWRFKLQQAALRN